MNPKKSDITTPKQRPKKENPIGNKTWSQIKKNSHNWQYQNKQTKDTNYWYEEQSSITEKALHNQHTYSLKKHKKGCNPNTQEVYKGRDKKEY